MCGICGYIDYTNQKPEKQVLEKMLNVMSYRGPDDTGVFIDNGIGLGHKRLNIIDLSPAGHQPMCNEDKTIWLTCNGEIYNFLEIKEELCNLGHKFSSRTDIEVIIHAYEEWRKKCLEKLNGMFAFAIWDSKNRTLFIAKDRLGKKPLHYTRVNNKFIFASEIKSLLSHPAVAAKLDLNSIQKYFVYEYVPSPHTIYEDIYKLQAGHYIKADEKGNTEIKKYWDIDFSNKINPDISEEELSGEIRNRLTESIRMRLTSDVPIGVFLSGGIDSGALTALIAGNNMLSKVKTFTIGFREKEFDESMYAEAVAKRFNTEHYKKEFDIKALLDNLPHVIGFMDEPFADPSIMPTYLLSKFAKEHITVALGGEGGDELFFGYSIFKAHKIAGYFDILPQSLRVLAGNISDKYINSYKLNRFLSGLKYDSVFRTQAWLSAVLPDQLSNLLVSGGNKKSDVFEDIENIEGTKNIRDFLDKISYHYIKFYLHDDILVKIDRASMANSLEVRAPFLDYKFVEFIASLPAELKMKNLRSKYIFKKSLENILPKEILNRKKQGFGIPVSSWLKNELKGYLLELFEEKKVKKDGIFNYSFINSLINEHISGKKDHKKALWSILIFQLWYNRHMKKG